ncbi:MAG: endospore germination permease, partial [Desulfobacterales bacterium]|nr:endospore germination permease [Desulfobacterales bacterium]
VKKEVISDKQRLSLFILFIIGTNVIMGTGLSAEQDVWLAILLGMLLSLPIILVYARLQSLFPTKNLFDIIETCFGKFIGKIVMIILTLFVFESIAQIIRNYGQFSVSVILRVTPQVIIELLLMTFCIWVVKEGIEVLGRWSQFFITPIILALLTTIFLLIVDMDINNIRPVFKNGMKSILKGAFEAFSFPFTQTIAFTMVFSNFMNKKSVYGVYILGQLIGGIILFIIILAIVLVLGINKSSILYYPFYDTIARINIADFFQRVEIVAGSIFLIGVFIKTSIFLMATCKGVAKILDLNDYRSLVTPIGLLAVILSYIEFDSMFAYFDFGGTIWYFYAFPFQVLFPILILIVAEIKKRYMGKGINE